MHVTLNPGNYYIIINCIILEWNLYMSIMMLILLIELRSHISGSEIEYKKYLVVFLWIA